MIKPIGLDMTARAFSQKLEKWASEEGEALFLSELSENSYASYLHPKGHMRKVVSPRKTPSPELYGAYAYYDLRFYLKTFSLKQILETDYLEMTVKYVLYIAFGKGYSDLVKADKVYINANAKHDTGIVLNPYSSEFKVGTGGYVLIQIPVKQSPVMDPMELIFQTFKYRLLRTVDEKKTGLEIDINKILLARDDLYQRLFHTEEYLQEHDLTQEEIESVCGESVRFQFERSNR